MTILRERTAWRRTRAPRETSQPDDLTPTEAANVRRALRFLADWAWGWARLAGAMGIKKQTLEQGATRKGRRPTAGFAIRAARVAIVRVESILSGKWPGTVTPKGWRPMPRPRR